MNKLNRTHRYSIENKKTLPPCRTANTKLHTLYVDSFCVTHTCHMLSLTGRSDCCHLQKCTHSWLNLCRRYINNKRQSEEEAFWRHWKEREKDKEREGGLSWRGTRWKEKVYNRWDRKGPERRTSELQKNAAWPSLLLQSVWSWQEARVYSCL